MPDPDHTIAVAQRIEVTEQELNIAERELYEKLVDYLLDDVKASLLEAHDERHG